MADKENGADWRPIETAPKDGHILAWSEQDGVMRCFWGSYLKHDQPHWCGVYLTYESEERFVDVGPDLTHWMPLPAPPIS